VTYEVSSQAGSRCVHLKVNEYPALRVDRHQLIGLVVELAVLERNLRGRVGRQEGDGGAARDHRRVEHLHL